MNNILMYSVYLALSFQLFLILIHDVLGT